MKNNIKNEDILINSKVNVSSFIQKNRLYFLGDKTKEELFQEFSLSHTIFFIQLPNSKILRFNTSLPKEQKSEVSRSAKKMIFFHLDTEEALENLQLGWKMSAAHTESWRVNSKIFFIFYKNGLMQEEVAAERIQPWELKERLIASTKIKNLSQMKAKDKTEDDKKREHDFVILDHKVSQDTQSEPKDELWQDLAMLRDTRSPLSNVIKY